MILVLQIPNSFEDTRFCRFPYAICINSAIKCIAKSVDRRAQSIEVIVWIVIMLPFFTDTFNMTVKLAQNFHFYIMQYNPSLDLSQDPSNGIAFKKAVISILNHPAT